MRHRVDLGFAFRPSLLALLFLCLGLAPREAAAAPADAGTAGPVISVVSGDPEFVSGGDALIDLKLPAAFAPGQSIDVRVGGRDVSAAFRRLDDTSWRGLVSNLPQGKSELVARLCPNGPASCGDAPGARITLTNHPIQGPIFSGAQQQPFFCETQTAGLGPALDASCSAPTRVEFQYRTTAGRFAPLPDPAQRPADLATVTVSGTSMPFIVRVERGVINRGIYEFAALFDGAEPSPFRAEAGWNGKLLLTFGGGCNVGYHQGARTAGVLNEAALSRGFAVLSNSLFVNDTNCSPIVAAETAIMTKERMVEVYGPITSSIGSGGSGGAIMQYTIAHGYPGILNGLLPSISFADALSNQAPSDCLLLTNYLMTPGGAVLSPEQRQAIGGHQVFGTCRAWVSSFSDRIDATRGCSPLVPLSTIYDPIKNPDGVRCSLADHLVKQLGRDPQTGFARGVFDNTGLQYGLGALQAGIIGVDQFLDLNASIGGFDRDGLLQPGRSTADPAAIRAAFATGLISSGRGGLAQTPTIDLRSYTDRIGDDLNGDIHTSFWSVAIHERLVRDGVDPRSHSRWIFQRGDDRFAQALDAMDAWVTAIAADTAPGTPAEKVARNQPREAAPGCWPRPGGDKMLDIDACYAGPFPFTGDVRTAAGAPITTDVTCNTKAPSPADYAVAFTPAQWTRLQSIFPGGVCDYTALPGVGQVPIRGTFQSFE